MDVKDGKVLQLVGTDLYRHKDEDFWVKMLDYQFQEEKPEVAIIPDVRFPNEINWIEAKGGICIRMTRWVHMCDEMYYTDDRPKDHPSEIALDDHTFKFNFDAVSGDLQSIKDYARWIKKNI